MEGKYFLEQFGRKSGKTKKDDKIVKLFFHLGQPFHRVPLKGMSPDVFVASKNPADFDAVFLAGRHDFQGSVSHAVQYDGAGFPLESAPDRLLFYNIKQPQTPPW